MPKLFVKEVTTEEQFGPVIDCLWDAYYDPYEPFMNIMFPVFANTDEGYASSVAESKTRLWAGHVEDPSSHWVYVTDAEGNVLSGAHWEFHEVSPFKEGAPKLEAVWHPEGEGREFATRVVNEIYGLRFKRLLRPHAQLDLMFTYPKERRKGYGGMLMQWGMDKASEMGVEVAVESSEHGYGLYKKFGLRSIQKIAVDTKVDNPSNTWKRLESDFRDTLIWWMWKPHGGIHGEGNDKLPWE